MYFEDFNMFKGNNCAVASIIIASQLTFELSIEHTWIWENEGSY